MNASQDSESSLVGCLLHNRAKRSVLEFAASAIKRKGVNVSAEAGKRQRTAVKEMREADCVYDRAAPYLLVTARFPIDALTSEWSIGMNRPIDQAHKRRLRQIFDEAGVLRRDASHRLQVACSKAQVQQMLDHLKDKGLAQTTATAAESAEGDSKWPSFEGWGSIIREKAELIAGHHRVEAFKEYLRFRELLEEERWWWVNRELEKVLDCDNNKPALWKDLIPALRAKYGDKANKTSRVFKQRILNNVRKNANHFTSITLDHYLYEYPGADGDAYGARFGHKLNLSLLPDLWPSPSPAATATQLTNELQSDDSLDDDSGDDDRLYGDASLGGLGDDCSESSFSDKEQVVVAAEQYSWKIDHAKGDYKFRDYGSRKAGSRAAALEDEYIPSFFLDLLIIVGRPLRPITQPSSRFFDNMTISFRNWRAPYSNKHIHGLSFDLEHRTFRLATAATRESWFIVMHPVANAPEELLSRSERRKRCEKSSQCSALQLHHAQFLASYIKEVFLVGELLGEGVELSWRLDGPHTQKITFNKWTTFQEVFMLGWPEHVRQSTQDTFWTENQLAFHAYDYGANIEIDVAD
ncbi:unnamed protein product [Alternaria alternata]